MNIPVRPSFFGCDIGILGSQEVLELSRCWRANKVRMDHRRDGKVDVTLKCDSMDCSCAQALAAQIKPN